MSPPDKGLKIEKTPINIAFRSPPDSGVQTRPPSSTPNKARATTLIGLGLGCILAAILLVVKTLPEAPHMPRIDKERGDR